MRKRRLVLLFAALACCKAAFGLQTFAGRYGADLQALWENRGDPAGIVYLYRAEALVDSQDGGDALEQTLARVIAAPDSDGEVRAHAAFALETLFRASGRIAEAEALDATLGFVKAWRVVGPFDDENKQGFDTAYPPETATAWTGSFEGKGHAVAWRAMPGPAPFGLVPMDQLLSPSEKTAGYALSFVRVEKDTPCVLRGSYNESYKLWVDGEFLGGQKLYNGRALDQFADPCTLRKGWNAILIKICNQEAAWNFMLRITDAEGQALKGWRATADPAQVDERGEAILSKSGAPPQGVSVNDPEAKLRQRVEKDPTPSNQALLGQYLSHEKTFDRDEDPDVELLRTAAEKAGQDGRLWIALGDAESDSNRRRAAYQRALDADPQDSMALDRLGRYYLRRNMPIVGLEKIRAARKADPDSPALAALEGQALLAFPSDGLAAADLKKLYKAHPRCTAVQEAAIDALKAMGQTTEAAAVQEAYWQSHQDEPGAWYIVIADLVGIGHTSEALERLGQMAVRFPFDRTVAYRAASYLLSLDRKAEAERVLAGAVDWAPDWPEGRELMGDILQAEGKGKDALSSYQLALILRPQMESVKRKVEFLKPQDEGLESKYRIEAKDLATDLGAYGGQQAVVLLDNTAVQVERNGLSSRYVQRVIQVLQPGAVQQMQSWPIPFDPDREEVRVLEASVIKPDGRRVHAETAVTDTLSDPQYRLYYRNRNLILNFSSLAAGDRIWIEFKKSDVSEQNDYGRYFGDLVPFAGMIPMVMKQYTVVLPEDFPLFIEAKGVEAQPMVVTVQGRKAYRWVARDIARIQAEPGMPGFTDVAPYLHLSTFQDWDAMGHWYAKFIADQWEMTPEIKAKVAELAAGAKTPEDKVRAIHRWVVQQTHYVGLEFGVHGYRPYKVKQIFDRRFGDCKDKALLLTAMLNEAGVDASMVLIRTRDNGSLEPKPASLAIFNHAICYVPELDLFLDGTAEYTGLRELPYQDQGVWVQLVWRDGRTRRVQTPLDRPGDNWYKASYKLEVPRTGVDGAGSGEVSIFGQECSWVRRRYQDQDKQRELLEKDLSGSFPGTHLASVTASPMRDLSAPIALTFTGTVGQIFRPDGKDRISAPMWLGRLSLTTMYASLQTRTLPIELDYPWTQTYSVTYLLPPGARPSTPSAQKIESPFGSAVREVREEAGSITVKTTVSVDAQRVSLNQYDAFRAFCQRVDLLMEERLRIALSGGGAP